MPAGGEAGDLCGSFAVLIPEPLSCTQGQNSSLGLRELTCVTPEARGSQPPELVELV